MAELFHWVVTCPKIPFLHSLQTLELYQINMGDDSNKILPKWKEDIAKMEWKNLGVYSEKRLLRNTKD